jgi:hypothetical protein
MTMPRYLLSAHQVEGETRAPMTPEHIQRVTAQVNALEAEMAAARVWVFGGRLHAPDAATVVRTINGEVITTDGPFVESKEHLGGFYVIDAADLDAALAWAGRVSALVDTPIEVRPFAEMPKD